jgi:hypothetical protein
MAGMEPRKTPPEYFLEIFADTTHVRDVLKGESHDNSLPRAIQTSCRAKIANSSLRPGVLNLIFFHRYFPSIRPVTFDVLDFTLPAINDADLETLIESRVSALVRQHLSSAAGGQDGPTPGGGGGVRGRIAVEFYEKKRRRPGHWFGGLTGKGEEEVCWEIWTLDVTIATPRTESGMYKLCYMLRAFLLLSPTLVLLTPAFF